jgi:hypothetical protein
MDGYTIGGVRGYMATDFDFLKEAPWLEGENIPVPVADPADLKIVWEWQRKLKKERPGKQFGFNIRHLQKVCSPGADACAVWYRISTLQMLEFICEKTGKNLPWSLADNPDDSILSLLSKHPMTGARSSEIEELIRILS